MAAKVIAERAFIVRRNLLKIPERRAIRSQHMEGLTHQIATNRVNVPVHVAPKRQALEPSANGSPASRVCLS